VERQQLYERADGRARSVLPGFRARLFGSKLLGFRAVYLPFWPGMPILVGCLARLVHVPLGYQSGGIGKYRQIFGALRAHGEQVKMPGRSSQMGSLR